MKNLKFKRGDKVRYIGKPEPGGWTTGIFIQYLDKRRAEVLPSACTFVTVDPLISEIEKHDWK